MIARASAAAAAPRAEFNGPDLNSLVAARPGFSFQTIREASIAGKSSVMKDVENTTEKPARSAFCFNSLAAYLRSCLLCSSNSDHSHGC